MVVGKVDASLGVNEGCHVDHPPGSWMTELGARTERGGPFRELGNARGLLKLEIIVLLHFKAVSSLTRLH
jgi:hypothetical protein